MVSVAVTSMVLVAVEYTSETRVALVWSVSVAVTVTVHVEVLQKG